MSGSKKSATAKNINKYGNPKICPSKSGIPKSGTPKSGTPKSSSTKSGTQKFDITKSAIAKIGYPKSGTTKTSTKKSGKTKVKTPKPVKPMLKHQSLKAAYKALKVSLKRAEARYLESDCYILKCELCLNKFKTLNQLHNHVPMHFKIYLERKEEKNLWMV